eukprot:TRINITY_DN52446_c0_g2_i1.p1 TRINITY_DN52446_c0_g2~~TRINITY_DN52446_c0_g2_i1.p1  ORF type:complete len:591 (+),score=87.46 TRINITY_DN52446_c0_g2_i1:41-1774(+)
MPSLRSYLQLAHQLPVGSSPVQRPPAAQQQNTAKQDDETKRVVVHGDGSSSVVFPSSGSAPTIVHQYKRNDSPDDGEASSTNLLGARRYSKSKSLDSVRALPPNLVGAATENALESPIKPSTSLAGPLKHTPGTTAPAVISHSNSTNLSTYQMSGSASAPNVNITAYTPPDPLEPEPETPNPSTYDATQLLQEAAFHPASASSPSVLLTRGTNGGVTTFTSSSTGDIHNHHYGEHHQNFAQPHTEAEENDLNAAYMALHTSTAGPLHTTSSATTPSLSVSPPESTLNAGPLPSPPSGGSTGAPTQTQQQLAQAGGLYSSQFVLQQQQQQQQQIQHLSDVYNPKMGINLMASHAAAVHPPGFPGSASNDSGLASVVSGGSSGSGSGSGTGAANPAGGTQVDLGKYKTKMCRKWQKNGTCPYGASCCFAHGEHELQTLAAAAQNFASTNQHVSHQQLVAQLQQQQQTQRQHRHTIQTFSHTTAPTTIHQHTHQHHATTLYATHQHAMHTPQAVTTLPTAATATGNSLAALSTEEMFKLAQLLPPQDAATLQMQHAEATQAQKNNPVTVAGFQPHPPAAL